MSPLDRINSLPPNEVRADFQRCCGSSQWIAKMVAARPFNTESELLSASEREWFALAESDWLEAFSHHPKIGERGGGGGIETLRKKFPSTAAWASNEQSGINTANDETLHALAAGNAAYEKKFGFIFIVCATGKSAPEMLALLESRLANDRQKELETAAIEQSKITQPRLQKLLTTI